MKYIHWKDDAGEMVGVIDWDSQESIPEDQTTFLVNLPVYGTRITMPLLPETPTSESDVEIAVYILAERWMPGLKTSGDLPMCWDKTYEGLVAYFTKTQDTVITTYDDFESFFANHCEAFL